MIRLMQRFVSSVMPSQDGWSEFKLAELMDIKHGFAFQGEFFTAEPTNNVLLTPGNFAIGGGFQEGTPKYYAGPVPDEYILEPGDLIVTMTDLSKNGDTLGYPAIVPVSRTKKYLHNQRLGKIIICDSTKIIPLFAYYLMRGQDYRAEVLAGATGTTVKHTSPSRILAFSATIPSLSEQLAITRILGALDDKIELNRRMNRTLEAMAAALFKSWFVDFDPVVAKAEGGQPYGMSAETAALFPAAFQDSELGPIPAGWTVGRIADLCSSLDSGGTPSRQDSRFWVGGTIPWFKTGELTDGPLLKSDEHITPLGLNRSSCKLWTPGTILFAIYASPTLGRMGILEIDATANQACAGLVAKAEFGTHFLFHILLGAREELQRIASGAAQQNINQRILREHKTITAPPSLAQVFDAQVRKLYRLRVTNDSESLTLAMIRDALMPKLLSGEIRVKQAEREVAQAI